MFVLKFKLKEVVLLLVDAIVIFYKCRLFYKFFSIMLAF